MSYSLQVKFEHFDFNSIKEWMPMGLPHIYTYLPSNYDTNDCFNVEKIIPYLPCNSYCEQPYLIKYEQGGCFPGHNDLKINDEHIGAVVIYPPLSSNTRFEGGELLIGDNIYKNFSSEEYIIVFISINDWHEVTPVISGTRYCFLAPVFTKD